MTGVLRQIPAIGSKIDPAVAKILQPMKEQLDELYGGSSRAVRIADLLALSGLKFSIKRNVLDVDLSEIPIEDRLAAATKELEARQAELVTAQSEVSQVASRLLAAQATTDDLTSIFDESLVLKINVNGYIAGYGVAVVGADSQHPAKSDFIIQSDRFAVVFPTPGWAATTAYASGQYVTPVYGGNTGYAGTGLIYEVTAAGTTGATEPVWPTIVGNTVISGTVTFTARTPGSNVPFIVGNVGGVPTVGIDGNLVVDGTIVAQALNVTQLSAITADLGAITAGTIVLSTSGFIRSGQTAYDTGVGFWLGIDGATPKFSIGNAAGNRLTWDGTTLTVVGSVSGSLNAADLVGTIPLSTLDLATQGWQYDGAFSATDADTVAWASGTFRAADGTTYSITGSNTGNMVARTYIYLDIGVSTTAFQTSTTASDAVGLGKVLIAVAQNGTSEPFVQVFGGIGGINGVNFSALEGTISAAQIAASTITASHIAANTITANEIAANTITANQIAANTITATELAATITFTKELLISTSGKIRQGKTTAADTTAGFWIGYDGTGNYDLHIGDATVSLWWDGSAGTLKVLGDLQFGATSSFTPTWTGFSTPPTGTLSYLDMGSWALIFVPAQRSGTSNSTAFSFSGLPGAITPSLVAQVGGVIALDNSASAIAKAAVNTSGVVTFLRYAVSGSDVILTSWTGSGTKGLQAGNVIVYPL